MPGGRGACASALFFALFAVRGMLQKNTIANWQLTRLRVFRGAEHTHAAQKPEVWDR